MVTLSDFGEEIDRIAEELPQNGHGPQQFLRGETSLAKEIFVHEPLYDQLESDRRVILVFGHPLSYGAAV
jgi:hypothetical protein